jgi:glycine C-acetyltransferase
MFSKKAREGFTTTLQEIKQAGLFKDERVILTPQGADIRVKDGEVINFCANNYLGLSNHPKLVAAAKEGLDRYGYGMSSVRFICGTQDIHKTLEKEIASFLGTDDTILYSSCFDANGGLFETLLDAECAIISDALNHASVIDGIRLCKAERKVYQHGDMADLEARLKETQAAKIRMVATDGAFSMDGDLAKLDQICDLADKYDAMVMVDDSHCTGFIGKTGRGTPEHYGVQSRVDVVTSTMGKAMGGASGGFTSGRQALIDMLRQRSRPYLFSNTLAPAIVYTAIAAFRMLTETTELRDTLEANTKYFRSQMTAKGFDIRPGFHPIIPIMLGDAKLAHDIARDLLAEGIYVIGFSYPVVPKGQARIRVQISAAHTRAQLDKAIAAFAKVGKKYDILHKTKEQIIAKYGE